MRDPLTDLRERVARLEGQYARVTSVLGVGGTVTFAEGPGLPQAGVPAVLSPFPGALVTAPPGCSLKLADAAHDPTVIAGGMTKAARAAAAANPVIASVLAAGGCALVDAATATGGIAWQPGKVTFLGAPEVSIGGAPPVAMEVP